MAPLCNEDGEMLFVAGEEVPAGHYVRVDAARARELWLESRDFLPASHDGHVAVYRRVDRDWLVVIAAGENGDRETATGL